MGYKCFDPENRNYVNTLNFYFNAEQPLQIDDFSDYNSDAVCALYLDPDAPLPVSSPISCPAAGGASQAADNVAVSPGAHPGGALGPLTSSPASLAADVVEASS